MILLSICITVYNQKDLVYRDISELVKYKGNDIQVIISDDCSSENIEQLVDNFNDYRIKYIRTAHNIGHDNNIINAIKASDGKYVMILRSRDFVTASDVENIVDNIRDKNFAYAMFSAKDEMNNPRIVLSNKLYHAGEETIAACTKLLIHPSGQIYKKDMIDCSLILNHINDHFSDKYGFESHILMRYYLAEKGDFQTFSVYGWHYCNTLKSKDTAQNSIGNGISVYDPQYSYKRYKCEFDFINANISSNNKKKLYRFIIKLYYRLILINFDSMNKNKEMQKHYNYHEKDYSSKDEWSVFKKYSYSLFDTDVENVSNLRNYLSYIRGIGLWYKLLNVINNRFSDNLLYKVIYKKIKKI